MSQAGSRALLATWLLWGCACSAPEEPGCATDGDCPAGQRCSGGACAPAGAGGGGAGGGAAVEDECRASDDCLAGEFPLIPPITWDGTLDGVDPVCTVPLLTCPGDVECKVPTVCAPALEGATRLGAMSCEQDAQCAGGRCVALQGGSLCLRVCLTDPDCPALFPPDVGTPVGFRCAEVVQENIPLRLCVPIDPALPDRTLCDEDCDCPAAGGCPGSAAEPLCRFVGAGHALMRALPLCDLPHQGTASLPVLAQCPEDPALCLGGGCSTACQSKQSGETEHFCIDPPARCTAPCKRDATCPHRTVCRTGYDDERVGSWPNDEVFQGRELHYCLLPSEGCYDEQDCCPAPDGQGGCLKGWSADRRRCGVLLTRPTTNPRLLTSCLPIDPALGLSTPGECCSAAESCDSKLCVPARPGTPCAGGGVCSVPCDPDPFPAGAQGDPRDRDRCASFDFGAQSYHQGSRCSPFLFTAPYVDGDGAPATLEVTLNACQ